MSDRVRSMRQLGRRRSWICPGRRLPLAVMAAFATVAAAASTAGADQPVVSATIYPGAQGSVSARAASLSQLQACPLYSGPNPIYLYPGQQPYQAPPGSTWSLSDVLACGLGIPAGQVSAVQVQTINRGYEAQLTNAGLSDPSQYNDPSAPGALPVISSDGAENQTTYVRPYRGGSDDNAGDEVVQTGAPISLLVYLNGSLLTVTASQQTLSHTAGTKAVKLAATVRDATGTPIPASALTWSWTFGDGHGSTVPAPTHTFSSGVYGVSVQVTDAAAGSGGTATLRVAFTASGRTDARNQSGGTKPTTSKSPTGSDHASHKPTPGTHTTSTTTEHRTTPTTPTRSTTETPSSATATATTTSTTTITATTTPPATTSTATPRRRTVHNRPPSPVPAPRGPLVTGQLISDVTPLPSGSSPLVHVTPAAATPEAAVRQASRVSVTPAVGAALAVGVLLALGAGRELRGRRRWLDADGS